jgi:rhodanese-related sulfurtransferase
MPHQAGRAQVRELSGAGAQLVEVLPREEYDWAHLPGAINLPLKELETQLERLDRSRPVVLYCNDFV